MVRPHSQYLESPQIGNQWFETRFWRRFWLPYTSFLEFANSGLPGAIGSMDATHVVLEWRVNYKLRQSHLGHKFTATARTYNIVCNHCRRVLSTTEGHPARWNDKSIVKFDHFVMGIKEGTVLLKNDFRLLLYDYSSTAGDGSIITKDYQGPWILCENGYHKNWSATIPPFKATNSRKELQFSNWLELMRKDVAGVHIWNHERPVANFEDRHPDP